eukprot:328326_1
MLQKSTNQLVDHQQNVRNMTLFDITLDEWAKGKHSTTTSTIIIQSICLFISLILTIIRIYQMYKQLNKYKSDPKLVLLPITQFIMMFLSCLYIFFHEWNYIHLYFESNSMDCAIWFGLIMISLTLTRVLLFAFLMLRSSLSFENTFCAIPLSLSITIVTITTLGSIIPASILLTDFIPIQPFPANGFCFRIVGETAVICGTIFHLLNCVLSIVALIIFYIKSRSVRQLFDALDKDGKMSDNLVDLNFQFRKHIKLGMITIIGTVVIFFVQDMFSVLIGISFAFDQTINNILTFIMFKENSSVYNFLFCKHRQLESEINVVNLQDMQKKRAHSVATMSSKNTEISAPTMTVTSDMTVPEIPTNTSNSKHVNVAVIH